MRLSTFTVSLLAATVIASPMPNPAPAELSATDAQTQMNAKIAAGCDYVGCIAALATATGACVAAAAEGGLNIAADLACFGSVGAGIDKQPCAGC